MADIESLLRDGIAAVKRGDRTTARKLLTRVVEHDAQNEKAWMWLAASSTHTDERREFLLKVLSINPTNQRAQQALASLAMQSPPVSASEPEPIQPDDSDQLVRDSAPVSEPEPEPVQSKPIPKQPAKRKPAPSDDLRSPSPKKSPINLKALIIGALVLVLAGALVFFAITLKNLLDKQDAPLIVAEASPPPPTFTLPPMPTATQTPLPLSDGSSLAPTLPPTFTPTATLTHTPEPTATQTPVPQDEFLILFTLLEDGADAPSLYSMAGDGTNVQRLETNIRDIAFDPSGTQIAFVRDDFQEDVTGEMLLVPQLFIAPFDDLSQATRLTDNRGTRLGQPSWSPEAREIVFVSNQDSEVDDLWVVSLDGSLPYRLTDSEMNAYQPAWRPILGSREVVYAYDGSLGLQINKLEVREIDAPDYHIQRMTNQPNSYAPSWNANGQRITFLSDRQLDADVYHMDANGSDQRLVTVDDNGAEDRSPHYTPDGRFIAFVSNRMNGRFNIFLSTPDGASLTQLTDYENADVIQLIYRPELFFRLSK